MTIVSKVRIQRGKSLNIPIKLEQQFDITGNGMDIKKFSDDTLQQIINPIKDYEVAKFIHQYDDYGDNGMYLKFGFIDYETNEYVSDYGLMGFSPSELIKFSNAVKGSFFKLDFFDSPNREKQKLQFTKIIPMYLSLKNGQITDIVDGVETNISIDGVSTFITPEFYSDSLINNEIQDMFIFKSEDTKNIDEFYVGCRFFNAKNGDVVRMTNYQDTDEGVNPRQDYYHKLVIDRVNRTYVINDFLGGDEGVRIGDSENNPISFYQML